MKATEQYFPVVLFIMFYKVVLSFESVDEILKCDIQMKSSEQYFPVVLFIMLYDLVHSCRSICFVQCFANKIWTFFRISFVSLGIVLRKRFISPFPTNGNA